MYKLKSGLTVPAMGLGTWQSEGQECQRAVEYALEIGYRQIDTAWIYGNQRQIAKGGKASGVPRKDIFITSKLWREHLRKADAERQLGETLKQLDTDYLDLYLIHWPNKAVPMAETLEFLMAAKEAGQIKAIGVSNFTIGHLKEALKITRDIDVNQVEFHPSLNQKELENFCAENGIAITAYSPLGQGYDLKLPVVRELAKKYGRTEAQVVINWCLAHDMIVIPKSVTPERILSNLQSFEWQLEPADVARLDAINDDYRVANPPFAEFDRK